MDDFRTMDVKVSVLGETTSISLHDKARRGWGKRRYVTKLKEGETLQACVMRAYEEHGKQLVLPEGV